MWGLVSFINSEKFSVLISDNIPSFRVGTSSWGFDGMNADSASEGRLGGGQQAANGSAGQGADRVPLGWGQGDRNDLRRAGLLLFPLGTSGVRCVGPSPRIRATGS